MLTPLIILIIVFVVLIVADMIHYLLSAGLLFMFYMFALIIFDLSMIQVVFYALAIVFYIAVKAAKLGEKGDIPTNADSVDLNGPEKGGLLKNANFHLFTIGLGFVIMIIMFAITAKKGQILGVVALKATADGSLAQLTTLFAPAVSLSIGFIENRLFVTFYHLLREGKEVATAITDVLGNLEPDFSFIPFLGILINILTNSILIFTILFIHIFAIGIPLIFTCVLFGLFHLVAYHLMWKLIWWAAIIFFIWMLSYLATGKDTTAMDTAHGGWNGWITAGELQSFAIV